MTYSDKPRIAWVSPVADSAELRSAAFTQTLLPELTSRFEIECFVDDPDIATAKSLDVKCFHYHRLHERTQLKAFDAYVFQLENHLRAQFVRLCAKRYPGIVYLHDLSFNRLYYGLFRYTTAPTELNNLAIDEFGPDAPKIGDYHVRKWSYEIFDRQYPCGFADIREFAYPVVLQPAHQRIIDSIRQNEVSSSSACAQFPVRVSHSSSNQPKSMRGIRLLYTGTWYLSDRIWSFLSICAMLASDARQIEVEWLVANQLQRDAAMRRIDEFAKVHTDSDFSALQVLVASNEEIAKRIDSLTVLLNLRSDPRSAWPRGVVEALQNKATLLSTEAQWSQPGGAKHVHVFPEGVGDDLFVYKLLCHLAELAHLTLEAPVAAEVNTWGIAPCTEVVAELEELLHKEGAKLQTQVQYSQEMVANAARRLCEQQRREAEQGLSIGAFSLFDEIAK